MKGPVLIALAAAVACGALAAAPRTASKKAAPAKGKQASAAAKKAAVSSKKPAVAPAVKPKPLSAKVKKGLDWLAKRQLKSGGWGQGEESEAMGQQMEAQRDKANVADTCIAALALTRSGSTPHSGPYQENIRRALDYVCAEIEKSDGTSMQVSSTQGTRVQAKLGPYIDTFLVSLVLAEVKGSMPNSTSEQRIVKALGKTMTKIAKNQRPDGTWTNEGWAPTLAQSVATKSLNRAKQNGAEVNEEVRQRAEQQAQANFDRKSGGFAAAGPTAAGVDLYAASSSLGGLQDSANTNAELETAARGELAKAKTAPARREAERKLARYAQTRRDLAGAQQAVIAKLDDKAFVSGFGSNGGEEFLSYLNIGESLVAKGGAEWTKWDRSMTVNLNRVQNNDGSWSGHHCITGRTFCTSSALLVLMVDRTPVPIAAKIGRR